MISNVRSFMLVLSGALSLTLTGTALSAASPSAETADSNVRFREVALPGTALGQYHRAPTPDRAIREADKKLPQIAFAQYLNEPIHDNGIAGVVVSDFFGTGYDDIFVTNGGGKPNSLYMNLRGKGWVDVAKQAGVDLTGGEYSGACAGDINNDGHVDLYVLGRNTPNHLLLNQGNGTFKDVTVAGNAGAGNLSHNSCTMGDFHGTGRLDIAIANSWDMHNAKPILAVPYALNQSNQLLENLDGLHFKDVSDSSGFSHIDVQPQDIPPGEKPPFYAVNWAIAAVDLFQNGKQDIVVDSDQGAFPSRKNGGLNRGFTRIYENDGKGHFTDVTHRLGTDAAGGWMGLSFGDFNFDGTMDIFSTNAGDYLFLPLPEVGVKEGDYSTRWLLQRPDHTFTDPRDSNLKNPLKDGADPTLGGLGATPWGWGTSTLDYNNTGYTSIFYHGSMDGMFWVTADNPGALLRNNGPRGLRKGFYPSFTYDPSFANAINGKNQRDRSVTGVAVGDFNHSGFEDIVSVAQTLKKGGLTSYYSDGPFNFGSPFDKGASYLKTFQRIGGGPSVPSILLKPTGKDTVEGDLSVEMNQGNGNHWAAIRTLGTVGITPGGRVNRDGVGAVVKFTPRGLPAAIRPVVAGSSFASQDSLEGVFGMAKQRTGTAEVLWPGGVRNILYGVRAGERITIPEIPCSYTDTSVPFRTYVGCVKQSLAALVTAGKVSPPFAARLLTSAIKGYDDQQHH